MIKTIFISVISILFATLALKNTNYNLTTNYNFLLPKNCKKTSLYKSVLLTPRFYYKHQILDEQCKPLKEYTPSKAKIAYLNLGLTKIICRDLTLAFNTYSKLAFLKPLKLKLVAGSYWKLQFIHNGNLAKVLLPLQIESLHLEALSNLNNASLDLRFVYK